MITAIIQDKAKIIPAFMKLKVAIRYKGCYNILYSHKPVERGDFDGREL